MAKPKKTPVESIQTRVPFKNSTGSMRGETGAPSSHGWLSGTQFSEQIKGLKNPDYTVMSYNTPIAVHHEEGWHYPDVSHSATTGKHQSVVRYAIGVKNEREKTMERRAAKRVEKQKAASAQQELGLWNS